LIFKVIILFSTLLSFCFGETLVLEKGKKNYQIGTYLKILIDKDKKLTIEDITSGKYDSKFKKTERKDPSFSFLQAHFWAKLKIKNKSSFKSWILSQNYSQQDNIIF